jgi:signal transduction histidine kinase
MTIINQFSIPTLNDTPTDFDKLFELGNTVLADHGHVIFDFSKCQFLRPNAIAFLGGISRLIESKGRTVQFDFNTAPDKVLAILRQNNFAYCFGHPGFSGFPGRSIPYREDRTDLNQQTNLKDAIINYLSNEWLGRGWVHVSSRLRNAIVGVVWEIYDNAFEHANSSIGLYSCGQHFPRLRILQLAVADFGMGIPENVRRYLPNNPLVQLSPAHCLKWAFQEGASTKKQGTGRGLGLKLLKDFVNLNHGTLEIYSYNGYALVHDEKEKFHNIRNSLPGTIVNITLRCDESYYQFADETSVGPLF